MSVNMKSILILLIIFVNGILMAPSTTTPKPIIDPKRRQAVINYGKTLSREASAAAMKNIHQFNANLRQYANTIPRDSMLHDLALPMRFGSNIGNLGAPYAVSKFVAKPIEKASVAVADWIEQIGSTSDTLANFIANTLIGVDSTQDRKMVRRDINVSTNSTRKL